MDLGTRGNGRARATRFAVIGLSVAGLLVAGCSDSSSSSSTLPPVVLPNGSTATSPRPTTTRPTTTMRATTTSTSTTTAPTTTAASTTTTPPGLTYAAVAGPSIPDRTDPIDAAWLEPNGETLRTVADGTYWATADGTGGSARPYVRLRLVQAFFGAACIEQFGDGPDSCNNDYGLLETPTGAYPAYVADGQYVTVVDEATKRNHLIDANELFGLVNGQAPAGSAPTEFFYVPFPFVANVRNGAVISLEQVWVP